MAISKIELDQPATQAGFARLVGTSRQAINKHVEKGVLKDGMSYGDWLQVYCDRLRDEAGGRGGDQQATLTAVRIEETLENIAEKRQRRLTASGELMDRETVRQWIVEAASGIQGFVMGAGETIIESLTEKYKVEFEEDDVIGPLRSALGHVGNAGQELAERLTGLGELSSSDSADADSRVG